MSPIPQLSLSRPQDGARWETIYVHYYGYENSRSLFLMLVNSIIMWDVRVYHMTMWYAFWSCGMRFKNTRKLQFRIFKCRKWLKPWHKEKVRSVKCMGSYSIWEANWTRLDIWALMALPWHPSHGVWPHTPHNHLWFFYYYKSYKCVKYTLNIRLVEQCITGTDYDINIDLVPGRSRRASPW